MAARRSSSGKNTVKSLGQSPIVVLKSFRFYFWNRDLFCPAPQPVDSRIGHFKVLGLGRSGGNSHGAQGDVLQHLGQEGLALLISSRGLLALPAQEAGGRDARPRHFWFCLGRLSPYPGLLSGPWGCFWSLRSQRLLCWAACLPSCLSCSLWP